MDPKEIGVYLPVKEMPEGFRPESGLTTRLLYNQREFDDEIGNKTYYPFLTEWWNADFVQSNIPFTDHSGLIQIQKDQNPFTYFPSIYLNLFYLSGPYNQTISKWPYSLKQY